VSFSSVVSGIATAWVWLITSVMSPELRDRQRAERSAHLCDQIEHSTAAGQSSLQAAGDLALALVVGMPADIVVAFTSARFVKADSNEDVHVNWKLLVAVIGAIAVIAVVVVMIQGPQQVKQNGHLLWVRWLRAIGGIVLLRVAAQALLRQGLSRTRKGSVVFAMIVCVLIGAYLLRLGLSPS
jgi:hypothetical protein